MIKYIPKFGDVLQYKNGNTPLIVINYYPFTEEIEFTYLIFFCKKTCRRNIKYFTDYIGSTKYVNQCTVRQLKEKYGYENKKMLKFHPIITSTKEIKNSELSEREESEKQMTTLYEIPSKTKSGKSRFGTKLATNSNGEIVLEIKGSNGLVEAFDPKIINEVTPYTVSAYYADGGTAHYTTEKGSVEVGDIIMLGKSFSSCVVIRELDTKNKKAIAALKGTKILTEKI